MKSRGLETYLDEEGTEKTLRALGGVTRQALWNMRKERDIRIVEIGDGYTVWEQKKLGSGNIADLGDQGEQFDS